MANPYSVLGVSKDADEKAIKSAFRKLAKRYHPDQNADDANAQSKFAEINQAYEILGDQEKRAQFDRGEIDEKGQPKFSGFNGQGDPFGQFRQGGGAQGGPFGAGGFSGAEDILGDLFGAAFNQGRRGGGADPFSQFGGQGAQPRQHRQASLDLEINAVVTVEDLMRGKTSVKMPDGKLVSVSIPLRQTAVKSFA